MDNEQKNKYIMGRLRIRTEHDNMPYACTRTINRKHIPLLYERFQYKTGAEIGVSRGKHSELMLKMVPDLKLYCVDPYGVYHARRSQQRQDQIYESAYKRLSKYNAVMVRKTSMDAVKDFEDNFLDFVYIDGNHSFDYVMSDIIFWSQKVKSGGIVACHDYCHFHWSGIIKAVDAYVYCHDIRPWFITKEEKPTVFWVKP